MIRLSQLDTLEDMRGLEVCQLIEKIPEIINAFRSGWAIELLAERYKVKPLVVESVVRMAFRVEIKPSSFDDAPIYEDAD